MKSSIRNCLLGIMLLSLSSVAFANVQLWSIAGSITAKIGEAQAIAVPMGTDTSVFTSKDNCDTARKAMLSALVVKQRSTKLDGTIADYSLWVNVGGVVITDFTSCVPSVQY